jgi:hypothetical protein
MPESVIAPFVPIHNALVVAAIGCLIRTRM